MRKALLCACVGLLAAGCGTIMDTANIQCAATNQGPRVYGGVRTDCKLISESEDWLSTTVLVLDTPCSAFYDTCLLPATVVKYYNGK